METASDIITMGLNRSGHCSTEVLLPFQKLLSLRYGH